MESQPSSQASANDNLWDKFKEINVYADPWNLPEGAFEDIYHLLDQLCQPANHTQINGRRGTGKTVLMVQAYLTLLKRFETAKTKTPYRLAVYIDLSQDVEATDDPAPIRALEIYKQILNLILTASHRKGHRRDRRFWGLKDYIDDRPKILRRVYARWRLADYQYYINSLGDEIKKNAEFAQATKWNASIGAKAGLSTDQALKGFPLIGESNIAAGMSDEMEMRLSGAYRHFGGKVRSYLEAVLDAMQVEHLILFLDEWSGRSIGTDVQPFLYEQLTETFPAGGKIVLKLATIPGATQLTFRRSAVKIVPISINRLPVERRSLIRALLLNLQAYLGDHFPSDRYLNATQAKEGYPLFLADVFEKGAADVFFDASENIPRQMLLIFNRIAWLRRRYTPNHKISPELVKLAAKEHFAYIMDHTIRPDHTLDAIVDRLLKGGSRITDIERYEPLHSELDFLVDEGVIFRCDVGGRKGYQRFYLCYPAELYRLFQTRSAISQNEIEAFAKIVPDGSVLCSSDRRTPMVRISDLIKNKSDKSQL